MAEKEFEIPTPFGKVFLHPPSLPELEPPEMNEKRSDAMKHAIASDVGSIIGYIPVVGDIVADVVEDLHATQLRSLLTKDEMDEYMKQDKVAPSTIALLRAFMRK